MRNIHHLTPSVVTLEGKKRRQLDEEKIIQLLNSWCHVLEEDFIDPNGISGLLACLTRA